MPENLAKYSVDIDFKFLNQKNFEKFLRSIDALGKNLEKSFGDEKKSPLGKAIKNFEKLGKVLSKGTLGRLFTVAGTTSFIWKKMKDVDRDMQSLSLYKLRTGEGTQELQRLQMAGESMATPVGRATTQSTMENLRHQAYSYFFGGTPTLQAQQLGIAIGKSAEENFRTMLKRAKELASKDKGLAAEMLRGAGIDPRYLQMSDEEIDKYAATYSESQIQSAEESRKFRNEQLAKLNQNVDKIVAPLTVIGNFLTGGILGFVNNLIAPYNQFSKENLKSGNAFNNTFYIQSLDPKGAAEEILEHINNQSNLQAISPNP